MPADEAPVQAPEEEEAYEEGLLLGFDFGDIEHDLYFSNIKESLSGGNAGNIRYVEFQRVCLSSSTPGTAGPSLPTHPCCHASRKHDAHLSGLL